MGCEIGPGIAQFRESPHDGAVAHLLQASFALLLAAGGPAAAPAIRECPGIENGQAEQVSTDLFYARRAIAVVEAALSENEDALGAMLAPGAELIIWRGDYSRTRTSPGAAGAMAFARDLEPIGFQLQSVHRGPISRLVSDCRWKVAILFRTADPKVGVSVTFEFRDGLLASAGGSEVAILEGTISPRPAADPRSRPTE